MPTMMLSSRLFSNRAEIPDTASGSIPVKPGGLVTLDAPQQIVALNPNNPDDKFSFLFWHASRVLVATHVVTFSAPSDELNFFATAWYQKVGGNGPPPPPHVTTVAFSHDKDEVIADTPIAAATPDGAWTGPPSTVVSTTISAAPVVITAKALIDGFGEFASWLAIGGTASGKVLTVAAQSSSLAIAAFGIPQPDPCALLREERDGLSPGDFPTLAAFQRALAAANVRLHACERQHGEPLD